MSQLETILLSTLILFAIAIFTPAIIGYFRWEQRIKKKLISPMLNSMTVTA